MQNMKVLRKLLTWKAVPILGTFRKQEGCFKCDASLGYGMRPCLTKHHQPKVEEGIRNGFRLTPIGGLNIQMAPATYHISVGLG